MLFEFSSSQITSQFFIELCTIVWYRSQHSRGSWNLVDNNEIIAIPRKEKGGDLSLISVIFHTLKQVAFKRG